MPPDTARVLGIAGSARRAATRAAAVYVAVAALWILLSDLAVDALVASRVELTQLQTLKGWLFVAASGALVYWVVLRGRLAVARTEGHYRTVMEYMSSSVVLYRELPGEGDFEILELNGAARRAGRVENGEALGRRVTAVFPGVADAGLLDAMVRVAKTGRPEHLTVSYHDHRVSGWWSAYFYRLPGGELVGVYDDVTERILAEQALRQAHEELDGKVRQRTAELARANERLMELDRLKSMFIASMSHELRTPLNSIIGFTGILLQDMAGPLTPKQRDYLRRVYGSGKHLLSLITDVIDLSKIEAGRIDCYPTRFDLAGAVREATESVAPQAEAKGMAFEQRVPPDIELVTDRRRLMQCLVNLLDNAVKYSDGGPVAVAARSSNDDVNITVTDQGIGIADRDLPRLFQPFSRLDDAVARQVPGTGLGLYLTRKIAVEILQGDVSVESAAGGGSAFTLTVARKLRP